MTIESHQETRGFETEVTQLLNLMINSLYSNKEIFLRELISNASDAADRLRFEALADPALFENETDLKIWIDCDPKAQTITIKDNGIGMSRDEVIASIGTIAKSGTREFLASLTGDQSKDMKLIGQFGVGFYSAFIVSDKVTLKTRRAGLTQEHGVLWESTGDGTYTIENIEKESRGTEITLHLKPKEKEFLEPWKLRHTIVKYSDHIAFPILMTEDDKEEKKEETINRATALWTLPKSQITEEDYKTLYKHISHDFEDPLTWSHNKVEGKLEYISLLYLPQHAPFDLWQHDQHQGLKLYVNRIFIMDDVDHFLPRYLRFIKGIVDCNDLPLNISREILQHNEIIEKIRSGLIKRSLSLLTKLAQDDPEKYAQFWKEFGRVLKEGPAEDQTHREDIAKLLRFSSTHTEQADLSLDHYIDRMKPEQEKIYYVTAETAQAAKNSPHLEIFRKKEIEVLLLSDRIDEWLVTHLTEYKGKTLQSIAKGALDLGKLKSDEDQPTEDEQKDFEALLKTIQTVIGDKIKEARLTDRLIDSPVCIVADETDLNINMQRILKSIGQNLPDVKPIFELNPHHALIQHLKNESDQERLSEWIHLLFDQAVLAEGGQLEDPGRFVSKLNRFLLDLI